MSWIFFSTLNITQALPSWTHVVGMKVVIRKTMLMLLCLLAHSEWMICSYTLLTRVSKSVVAHPGCQMALSWGWVWSDKICRRSGKEKKLCSKKILSESCRYVKNTKRERERENLINSVSVFGFSLLNDATSSQASQEEEFSPSFFAHCHPNLSFYRAFLLMTFNSLTSLCLSPLSNTVEHCEMGFIYLWSCMGLSNVHLSCAAIIQSLIPSHVWGMKWEPAELPSSVVCM